MKNWTRKNAISSLKELIQKNKKVKRFGRNSQEHIRWLANGLRITEEIFGQNSRYYATLSAYTWDERGSMLLDGFDMEGQMERRHNAAYLIQMEQAEGLLLAALDHLKDSKI